MKQQERAKKFHNNKVQFAAATEIIPLSNAYQAVLDALKCWEAPDEQTAKYWHDCLQDEFPDTASPNTFWHEKSELAFRDFFSWGHDHDFGFSFARSGAMGKRHVEIASEAISRGMLPVNLRGKTILDIGCWSGGDLLLLSGLGGEVTAIEEHSRSGDSARRLCELVGCQAAISAMSLYQEKSEWRQKFDIIYCSGVIYHVTDPILFLRICFAYLKVGGQLILETKSYDANDSSCSYSGSLEKGWNWFAPTQEALGRWLVDVGFHIEDVMLYQRPIGRLMSYARKRTLKPLVETAGFSRPGSWLESLQ